MNSTLSVEAPDVSTTLDGDGLGMPAQMSIGQRGHAPLLRVTNCTVSGAGCHTPARQLAPARRVRVSNEPQ